MGCGNVMRLCIQIMILYLVLVWIIIPRTGSMLTLPGKFGAFLVHLVSVSGTDLRGVSCSFMQGCGESNIRSNHMGGQIFIAICEPNGKLHTANCIGICC